MEAPTLLVTGGGRGIGRAIALRFAREGFTVLVAARSRDELETVAAECSRAGGRGVPVVLDVSARASVERALESALEAAGDRLDVLVNNAGAFTVVPFRELTEETWKRLFAVNLDGVFHVTQTALPALERSSRPHLFNIASTAARIPFEGSAAYCATKYGLRGLSDVLRLELAPAGIRVTTVYPGATDTSIFDDVPGEWDKSGMNRPEDVADVVWKAWSTPRGEDVDDVDVPPPALREL